MPEEDSPVGDNAVDDHQSGVSSRHPDRSISAHQPDAYRFTAEEWLARNDRDWGAIEGALERLDGGPQA